MWQVAHRMNLAQTFERFFATRQLAVQGELVGPGIEENKYKLQQHRFYAYDVYDVKQGRYLEPLQRRAVVEQLGLQHVPVIDSAYTLSAADSMEAMLQRAQGPSMLLPSQTREGLVYKRCDAQESFKTISNTYLK